MKVIVSIIALFQLATLCLANRARYDDGYNSQVCAGMYSKHDWGGSKKPHIGLNLLEYGKDKYDSKKGKDQKTSEDINLTYVIFEYKDIEAIGHQFDDGNIKFICDDNAINDMKICDESQKGTFIIESDHTNVTVLSGKIDHLGKSDVNYPINSTGYYCVSTFVESPTMNYRGIINFQNAFGELSATEIPKLPSYGILTLLYVIAIALFGFQFYKKRKDNQILPLQKYLLAMLGLLAFDTLVVWSYYDLLNRTTNPLSGFVLFYMIFLSLLNACKLTFSFFLLLCIALGYGVVVVKLEKKIMFRCKLLAGCHFVTSFLYLASSYYTASNASLNNTSSFEDQQANELGTLLPLIPITITLTIYYALILVSIKKTTTNLNKQRQIIKLKLYENLFRLIFLAFLLTFGGIFFASFIFLSMSNTELVEQSWKGTFFVFDFAPSVVYLVIFMGIAWLWRPTETSYMLAVSQQLSTDESNQNDQGTEFELDDISLMSHDEEDNGQGNRDSFELRDDDYQAPPTTPPSYELADANKPIEQTNSNTLFELGEESDNERDDDRLKPKDPRT